MIAKLFRENNDRKNTLILFCVVVLFCVIGGKLRASLELSPFWPVNSILAAIIVRFPWLHRPRYYLISYAGMVFSEQFFFGWRMQAFTVNIANIIFVFLVAALLIRRYSPVNASVRMIRALRIFPVCLAASIISSVWGALVAGGHYDETFFHAWSDWMSEEFSTGVLLLPFLLTQPGTNQKLPAAWSLRQLLPGLSVVLSLVAVVLVGGGSCLSFPVPALIWCAIRYPLYVTSLITLLTGVTEILLLMKGFMHIQFQDTLLGLNQLFSARLSIATVAISPLIVAVSIDAIVQLNRQLALRANHDFLTRLLSRSGLYEKLRQYDISGKMISQHSGVILIDIDYFKSINDNFGHDAGDRVLEEIAHRINHVVGEAGAVCRFGGEEFVIVLFGYNNHQIFALAEDIRLAVGSEHFVLHGDAVHLTISLGIAGMTCQKKGCKETVNQLISIADKNLFRSKRNGRNQTSPQYPNEMAVKK